MNELKIASLMNRPHLQTSTPSTHTTQIHGRQIYFMGATVFTLMGFVCLDLYYPMSVVFWIAGLGFLQRTLGPKHRV